MIRVKRYRDVDLEFDGELIAESSSWADDKQRWQEIRLYRIAGPERRYVLERVGETSLPGEEVARYVDEYSDPADVRRRVQRVRPSGEHYLTLVALDVLDQAAANDDGFAALTERIG